MGAFSGGIAVSAGRLILVTCPPGVGEAGAEAAAVAVAAARLARREAAVLLDLGSGRSWGNAILASTTARRVAARSGWAGHGASAVARGRLAVVAAGEGSEPLSLLTECEGCGLPRIAYVPAPRLLPLLDLVPAGSAAVLLRAAGEADRDLCGAVAIEMRSLGVPIKVWRRGLGLVGRRRARAGLDPGGSDGSRATRTAAALGAHADGPPPVGAARSALAPGEESGQALPAVVGLVAVAATVCMALVGLGGAATAKGRAQRAVDLAALSAARSMRDDFERLFVPRRRPDGTPDPAHLSRARYLARAVAAARQAAARNGLAEARLGVEFPDRGSIAPLRVEVRGRLRIEIAGAEQGAGTRVTATAAASPDAGAAAAPPEVASGGGYAGPLAYRQGKPMRPDVAAAFDRLDRAARAAGHPLAINSAFRSDAEQAALFAAHPDPRWVAPPGHSLHRCGTELDLGPAGAYGWLAANARRFGFEQRYPWEPWHYGLTSGAEPCSAAAERGFTSGAGGRGGDGRGAGEPGLPGFVPAFARRPLIAAAARHGVSAQLLAAQLLAESNFNPAAVSPAGALGIAQFMPATAAAYGLDDPFDAAAAIEAQARLMADLMRRFGSPALALAAYNAGPGAVGACGCVPDFPETQAYVARILGILDGLDPAGGPRAALEVRLLA